MSFSGRWHDSIRGGRGSFLPIADVPLTECSQDEFDAYQEQSHFYATRWQQTDPLMFGIRRFMDQDVPSVENLVVEGYIAPLGREKYGWIARLLGDPVQTEIELPRDDMIHVQVHLSGDTPLGRQSPNHVLFAGIKDLVPPSQVKQRDCWQRCVFSSRYQATLELGPAPDISTDSPLVSEVAPRICTAFHAAFSDCGAGKVEALASFRSIEALSSNV